MAFDRKVQPVSKNRMAEATSPYLLQHADNPVHWQPWGQEAFDMAKERDVPVLLSVGYAACHWCHVMAHESFEDEAIAQELNDHFVCIKVDREERPDVDAVYMAVTVALNRGRGGWPMTVLMTPDKEPFFAGTYFPPRAKGGMPGFLQLLQRIHEMWRQQRPDLMQMAGQITSAVRSEAPPEAGEAPGPTATERLMAEAEATLAQRYDVDSGGFTPAPKFPHTETLRLLLLRRQKTPALTEMVQHTLDEMARGGLYDVVGGGFSRYSVDARWHVPHFEKMLYDNALLAATYAEAAMAFGKPGYRRVTQATLDFVLRELCHPDGTFYASLDADSEGHEGRFYVWTFEDALEVLSRSMPRDTTQKVLRALDFSEDGNWEDGVNIPRLSFGLPGDDEAIEQACALLFAARNKRERPGTDTKILTGHNGLMLTALALGCRALAKPSYLAHGCRAADILWEKSRGSDGLLMRLPITERGPKIPAMLEDYAYFAEGLLALYEAGGPPHLVQRCVQLCHELVQKCADPASGALYQTGADHETLLFRPKESHDGATPSAYAVAAHTLLRAAAHAGDGALQAAGEAALGAMAPDIEAAPHAHCRALLALDFFHHPGDEAAFVAADAPWHGSNDAVFAALAGHYAPHRLVAHNHGEVLAHPGPLLLHRPPQGDKPTIYLCRGQSCAPPITDVAELQRAQL